MPTLSSPKIEWPEPDLSGLPQSLKTMTVPQQCVFSARLPMDGADRAGKTVGNFNRAVKSLGGRSYGK
jgi:hypothetical protein